MSFNSKDVDNIENESIRIFSNMVESYLSSLEEDAFRYFLLQRRMLSYLGFTPAYDLAEAFFYEEEGVQKIIREIRQEEYPFKKPSHRCDLDTDLRAMSFSSEEILESHADEKTKKAINALLNLLVKTPDKAISQVRFLAVLRFGFEISVAEEYRHVVKKAEQLFGFQSRKSLFYQPHVYHDQKSCPITSLGTSHSEKFSAFLLEAIDDCKDGILVLEKTYRDIINAKKILYSSGA